MTTTIMVSRTVQDSDLFSRSAADTYYGLFVRNFMDGIISIEACLEDSFKRRLHAFEGTSPTSILDVCLQFPGEVYLVGGSLSVALDATLNPCDKLFDKSALDVFVLGCGDRKAMIVAQMFDMLHKAFGVGCFALTMENPSILNVWVMGKPRCLRIILVDEMFRTIEQLLPAMDFVHLQCAYDTEYITITKTALKAMAKRVTSYVPGFVANTPKTIRRVYKTQIRNYSVRDSPFSFSDVMRTCYSYLKRPDFIYTGNDDALAAHLGISRREVACSLETLEYKVDWDGIKELSCIDS